MEYISTLLKISLYTLFLYLSAGCGQKTETKSVSIPEDTISLIHVDTLRCYGNYNFFDVPGNNEFAEYFLGCHCKHEIPKSGYPYYDNKLDSSLKLKYKSLTDSILNNADWVYINGNKAKIETIYKSGHETGYLKLYGELSGIQYASLFLNKMSMYEYSQTKILSSSSEDLVVIFKENDFLIYNTYDDKGKIKKHKKFKHTTRFSLTDLKEHNLKRLVSVNLWETDNMYAKIMIFQNDDTIIQKYFSGFDTKGIIEGMGNEFYIFGKKLDRNVDTHDSLYIVRMDTDGNILSSVTYEADPYFNINTLFFKGYLVVTTVSTKHQDSHYLLLLKHDLTIVKKYVTYSADRSMKAASLLLSQKDKNSVFIYSQGLYFPDTSNTYDNKSVLFKDLLKLPK